MPPSTPAPSPGDSGLERALGPWTIGTNAVNLSLGGGIFALPAVVAAVLGPAAILAYLVCGLAIALVLTCYVELGSQTTRSGGAIAHIDDAFGPMAGFVAWVVYTLAYCTASVAAAALVLVDALSPSVPALREGIPRAASLLLLFGGLAAINIAGVRQGARVAVATTVAKLAPLVIVIATGFATMRWSGLGWTEWPPVATIGEGSLLLFFAFSGAEAALTPSGEIRDPAHARARGMLGGMAALVAIYVAVQMVSQGVLGAELPRQTEAPLAAVASRVLGPAGWNVMIACTVVAIFGMLAGDMLASPRAMLPMAADGLLPAAVGRAIRGSTRRTSRSRSTRPSPVCWRSRGRFGRSPCCRAARCSSSTSWSASPRSGCGSSARRRRERSARRAAPWCRWPAWPSPGWLLVQCTAAAKRRRLRGRWRRPQVSYLLRGLLRRARR
ncbi:MAG: APC family permease [Marinilabiliales bacterium]|nr:APC family permease [Marinilabiliales bacterium]